MRSSRSMTCESLASGSRWMRSTLPESVDGRACFIFHRLKPRIEAFKRCDSFRGLGLGTSQGVNARLKAAHLSFHLLHIADELGPLGTLPAGIAGGQKTVQNLDGRTSARHV